MSTKYIYGFDQSEANRPTGRFPIEILTASAKWIVVDELNDLPDPVNGVITLNSYTTYLLTAPIDLQGARIVCGQSNAIVGTIPEISSLKSTGLTGQALITTTGYLELRYLTLTADVLLDAKAAITDTFILSIDGCFFTNCTTLGTIRDYNTVILSRGASFNSAGLEFNGTLGSIVLSDYYIEVPASETFITVLNTADIGIRLRVTFSYVTVASGATAFNISDNALTLPESAIFDNVFFTGTGTFITGIVDVVKLLIFNTTGVANTSAIGTMFFNGNSDITSITSSGSYVSVVGTTSTNNSDRFSMTADNELTYIGAFEKTFMVVATVSATSANSINIAFRLAKNGTGSPSSTSTVTTSGTGDSKNVTVQGIFNLQENDTISLLTANLDTTADITVTNLNLIVHT